MKKTISAVLALLMLIAVCGCTQAPTAVRIAEVNKHGNLMLDTDFDALKARDIEVGDLITATVCGKDYDLPVCTDYTDVASGEMLCRFDMEDNEVSLAINSGSFAERTGAAEKQGDGWKTNTDSVSLKLKEKQGYLGAYKARHLERTNAREDYPDLTDAQFANFRAVAVSAIKPDTLYRSSDPLDDSIGRSGYAMAAMEAAGVNTVVNLSDSEQFVRESAAYPDSRYAGCGVVTVEMGFDFESAEFAEKVKKAVLFMTENDGPYLIHCKEGKDRTGFVCALLECFAGASADEVKDDYMLTFANYYGVQKTDAAYEIILQNNIVKTLCAVFDVETLDGADLSKEAEEYLLSAGLTESDLAALRAVLVK